MIAKHQVTTWTKRSSRKRWEKLRRKRECPTRRDAFHVPHEDAEKIIDKVLEELGETPDSDSDASDSNSTEEVTMRDRV